MVAIPLTHKKSTYAHPGVAPWAAGQGVLGQIVTRMRRLQVVSIVGITRGYKKFWNLGCSPPPARVDEIPRWSFGREYYHFPLRSCSSIHVDMKGIGKKVPFFPQK